jgi:hypothetical protein
MAEQGTEMLPEEFEATGESAFRMMAKHMESCGWPMPEDRRALRELLYAIMQEYRSAKERAGGAEGTGAAGAA